MVRKAEYWDIGGNLLKTTEVSDIREVQGIWAPHRIVVVNHKTEHTSTLRYSEVDYETEISDDIFTEPALRRGI